MHFLVHLFASLLARLPWRVLYLVADFAFDLVWNFGYRKGVVMHNLAIAFPEQTEAERRVIAREFYGRLIDSFVESVKCLTISKQDLSRRMQIDFTPVHEALRAGKPVQIHMGHHFNWELANLAMGIAAQNFPAITVYMPIANKAIDKLFYRMRSRFGTRLADATRLQRDLLPYRHQAYALILVADQAPPVPSKAIWTDFFNRDTPFLALPELSARRNGLPVLFFRLQRIRRGYYKGVFNLAVDNAGTLSAGELTHTYARYLEDGIRLDPPNWLWSHRRWKHSR